MGSRRLKRSALVKILRSFDVVEDKKGGKGSHTKFVQTRRDGRFTYPVSKGKDVLSCYVKACRRKVRLTPDDGITDAEFYSRA